MSKKKNANVNAKLYGLTPPPPYAMNVKTNIGKEFFKLLNKHFPLNNELNKLFNKNTVKLSYSCTKNMDAIITAHNNSEAYQY